VKVISSYQDKWENLYIIQKKRDHRIACTAEGIFWVLAVCGTDSCGELPFLQAETKFARKLFVM
jgi:hypothetical protein